MDIAALLDRAADRSSACMDTKVDSMHATAREPKRARVRVPAFKTPPKFHGKTPKTGKKERNWGQEREKQTAKFWAVLRREVWEKTKEKKKKREKEETKRKRGVKEKQKRRNKKEKNN